MPRRKRDPVLNGTRRPRRRPVPVQIPPDRIQLQQRINIDQPIIVQIVIHPHRPPHRRRPQHRILRRRPELPRKVRDPIPRHIHHPARINPHVIRRPLQFRPRFPLRRHIPPQYHRPHARRRRPIHRRIAIAVFNRGRRMKRPPHHPPHHQPRPPRRHYPRRITRRNPPPTGVMPRQPPRKYRRLRPRIHRRHRI